MKTGGYLLNPPLCIQPPQSGVLNKYLVNVKHASSQWFSTEVAFCPLPPGDMGTFANVLETFSVVTVQRGEERGEGAAGIYRVEARDAAKHHTMLRTASLTKNYLSQSINTMEVRNPVLIQRHPLINEK